METLFVIILFCMIVLLILSIISGLNGWDCFILFVSLTFAFFLFSISLVPFLDKEINHCARCNDLCNANEKICGSCLEDFVEWMKMEE